MDAISDAGTATPEEQTSRWKARGARREPPANGGGAVYGLGMIGAAAYFFGAAESGRDYLLAVPKTLFWPALLVYRLFTYLRG